MKHLLLSLTLILSANAWANDEFPLELTCEVGANIIYLHFNQDEDKSWWKNHSSNSSHIRAFFFDKGTDKQRFYSIDNIDNIEIKFQIGKLRDRGIFRVNRINGKLFTANFEDGQCYKGFKEYEKQI